MVHIDASLIRADVSWESLAVRHVEAGRSGKRRHGSDELTKKQGRQTGQLQEGLR